MNTNTHSDKTTRGKPLFTTYAVITLFLLIILITVNGLIQFRREKIEMYNLLQHQGEALVQSLEIAWHNAVLSESLVRQQVAERLLDNAYFIDRVMSLTGENPFILKQLVKETNIFRVIVIDAVGRFVLDSNPPYVLPGLPNPSSPPMDPANILPMVNPVLSGRKQHLMVGNEPLSPVRENLLWVAVARRTAPGAIIVTVQGEYLTRFISEISLSKIINQIGAKPGIEYLIYDDPFNRITAQKGESGPPPLAKPLFHYLSSEESSMTVSRTGKEVMEIRHPFSFQGRRIGLMRVGLSLSKLKETEHAMSAQALWFGGVMIALGICGIFLIFFHQYRQYRVQKSREEEIQRADKLISIGKLAAGVAHEIRNPLNAISMAIQRLQHEFLPEAEKDRKEFMEFSSVIREEIGRVDKIITDFLNFAKQYHTEKTNVRITKLIDDLVLFLGAEAEKSGIVMETSYAENGAEAWCDPGQIKQCLMNIIRNAIQAMPGGGKITISLEHTPEGAVIRVADTGPGLSPSQIDKIFEFYYTNKEGGIGLGLPIAQKIMEDHCGRIEVTSEEGQGATFILYLPCKSPNKKERGRNT
ncbi:MAG: sensor histidine kinase [bacterium]